MNKRIGYHGLRSWADGPVRQTGNKGLFKVMAFFYFEEDMSPLFPYINSIAERAELFNSPEMVRFLYKDIYCAVYPDRCLASPLDSKDEVRTFVDDLITYLAGIWKRRTTITPRTALFKPGKVPQILRLLPKTNCGDCGYKTCLAFAAMVAKQLAVPDLCPYVTRPSSQTFPVLDDQGCEVSQVTLHVNHQRIDEKPGPDKRVSIPQKAQEKQGSLPTGDSQAPRDTRTASGILPEPLTPREIEVLSLMGEGCTNPEISRHLDISPHTVKSHVIHIFNKLGINHRTQAVVWAARNGII